MTKRKPIHDRVLNATNKDELKAAYSEWAEQYDSDLVEELGYVAPVLAAKVLEKDLDDKTAQILDAGCGTGLVGEVLAREGYRDIHGLDFSEHMLQQARQKDIYTALHQADLTKRLDIDDNTYDAVISVGTFTCGHVGPQALNELVRITKPGGPICFTVRDTAWQDDNYRKTVQAMESRGKWEQEEELLTGYIEKEGSRCKICLYRVAA